MYKRSSRIVIVHVVNDGFKYRREWRREQPPLANPDQYSPSFVSTFTREQVYQSYYIAVGRPSSHRPIGNFWVASKTVNPALVSYRWSATGATGPE